MRIPKKWLNSAFFRFLLLLFNIHYNNYSDEYEFEPWFQYEIGPYEKGYTLYFPKPPNKLQYMREIFLKIGEYTGIDLVNYVDYHYAAYPDKKAFVRFLRYEIQERIKLKIFESYRLKLETIFEWVKEKEAAAQPANASLADGPAVLTNGLPGSKASPDHSQGPDSPLLNGGLILSLPAIEENALSIMQTSMNNMARSYAGKIVLNNQHHKEKIMQVLILLKDLKDPGKKAEQLFEHFSEMDLAAILRQLEEFSGERINTLQGKITAAKNNLDLNDPKVKKLTKALTDFFYR